VRVQVLNALSWHCYIAFGTQKFDRLVSVLVSGSQGRGRSALAHAHTQQGYGGPESRSQSDALHYSLYCDFQGDVLHILQLQITAPQCNNEFSAAFIIDPSCVCLASGCVSCRT
jgi:hypothetical protein